MDVRAEDCARFLDANLDAGVRAKALETLARVIAAGKSDYADHIAGELPYTGAQVLEVGCHYCWYAPFFLLRGATTYAGIDVEFDPGYDRIHGPRATLQAPLSITDFIACFPNCAMTLGDIRDLPPPAAPFDAAFMISTSEHFDDARACLAALALQMAPGGEIYISHHNYYGWNGHHRSPWSVAEIDLDDPKHREVVDWNHVLRRVQNLDTPNFLNYLRMHELVEIVEDYFTITRRDCIAYDENTGRGRLTSELRRRLSRYYAEELETLSLLLNARRRPEQVTATAVQNTGHRYRIELGWIERGDGHTYVTRLPGLGRLGPLKLLEEERELSPGASDFATIAGQGGGAWTVHFGNYLHFSTSDNTDPRRNGRRYVVASA
ncbi:MAG TPA: methyltransferase domain-containing protein [Stellaceae bacterium]|nr:methyltransferase domain-containing protein [Stellaceae bacterium]